MDLVAQEVLSNLENQVGHYLCPPSGLEDRELQVDLLGQVLLEDLAVLVAPDLLLLKSQVIRWDLGVLEGQEVQLVPHHHWDQGRLLVPEVQVLQVFLANLAYQVFQFLGTPVDREVLAFQANLAIPGLVVQKVLVVQVVLLVLEGPEFLVVPLGHLLHLDQEEVDL